MDDRHSNLISCRQLGGDAHAGPHEVRRGAPTRHVAFHPRRRRGEPRRYPRRCSGPLARRAVPDFVIGALIGLYVIKEAIEILRDAKSEANNETAKGGEGL